MTALLARMCCAAALMLGTTLGAWAQQTPAPTAPAVSSLPADIPLKRDAASGADADSGVRWTLAALFIAGLAAWGIAAARRRGKNTAALGTWLAGWRRLAEPGAPQDIRRIASTRLTPRHSLHVVEWSGRQLLLGCTEQSVQLLSETAVEPAAREARSP